MATVYVFQNLTEEFAAPDPADVPEVVSINQWLIGLISTVVAFFMVFFLSQSYTRFTAQWMLTMYARTHLANLACRAGGVWSCGAPNGEGEANKVTPWDIVRYAQAAHVAAYAMLSDDGYYDRPCFWAVITEHGLLSAAELDHATTKLPDRASAYQVLIAKAVTLTHRASSEGSISERIEMKLIDELQAVDGALSKLYYYKKQPIPIFYTHLVTALMAIFLPIISYVVAVGIPGDSAHPILSTFLGGIAVLILNIFILGIMALVRELETPFDSHGTALNVVEYVNGSLACALRVLSEAGWDTGNREAASPAVVSPSHSAVTIICADGS